MFVLLLVCRDLRVGVPLLGKMGSLNLYSPEFRQGKFYNYFLRMEDLIRLPGKGNWYDLNDGANRTYRHNFPDTPVRAVCPSPLLAPLRVHSCVGGTLGFFSACRGTWPRWTCTKWRRMPPTSGS